MPRVIHFEIHADNPARAVKFYQSVFDWQITKWDGPAEYWLVSTGKPEEPGINGAIIQRNHTIAGESVIAYICTIDVPSVEVYTTRITDHGGTVVVPKMAVPGVGWLVYMKDSEGNIFGIMQNDGSAPISA